MPGGRSTSPVILLPLLIGVVILVMLMAGRSRESPGERLPTLVYVTMSGVRACEDMRPIVKQLQEEYAGRLRVETVDVTAMPALALTYDITVFPGLILRDARGNELWRHEGFMRKQQIIAELRRRGIDKPGQSD